MQLIYFSKRSLNSVGKLISARKYFICGKFWNKDNNSLNKYRPGYRVSYIP